MKDDANTLTLRRGRERGKGDDENIRGAIHNMDASYCGV